MQPNFGDLANQMLYRLKRIDEQFNEIEALRENLMIERAEIVRWFRAGAAGAPPQSHSEVRAGRLESISR